MGSTPEPQKVNKEARYRVERNEARAERDALAERIERMQRSEITRLAGEHLSVGEDLFISGNSVADYLTESGDVGADKVAADVAVILQERPGLQKPFPRGYDPSQGHGGRPPREGGPSSWADLFKS